MIHLAHPDGRFFVWPHPFTTSRILREARTYLTERRAREEMELAPEGALAGFELRRY